MSLMRRALPLDDQISLDGLLEAAFAAGRTRTTGISAARVRARVAWEREAPVSRGWRAVSVFSRSTNEGDFVVAVREQQGLPR